MNIGDLVSDEWGYMAIIIAQVGVLDRWVIHYIESGNKSALFGSRLYPIRSKNVRESNK